jgi:hypothetical protein
MWHLLNVSNWQVAGFLFDGKQAGGDGTTTPQRALLAQARDVDVTGIVFRHNHVTNWALSKNASLTRGEALAFQGNQARKKFVRNSVITENVIDHVRGIGIAITHARNATISQNDISQLFCHMYIDAQGRRHSGAVGIKTRNTTTTADDPSADTMENVFEDNAIHDFPDGVTCAEESGLPAYEAGLIGFWCDIGAKAGLVRRNKIYNLGYLSGASLYGGRGLHFESRCHGHIAEGNEISKIGGSGIEVRNANDVQIRHNTIQDTRWLGVNLKDGARAMILDNSFSTIRLSGVHIASAAWRDGGHTIDHNRYDLVRQPGTIVGVTVPKTFVGWQQACRCEAHGHMGNLLVAPE